MNINEYVQQVQETPGAVLLDVRTPEEFAQGRIPGSVNIPLMQVASIPENYPDKATPLFVYCAVGARAGVAVSWLENAGYTKAINIGGINSWRGSLEK